MKRPLYASRLLLALAVCLILASANNAGAQGNSGEHGHGNGKDKHQGEGNGHRDGDGDQGDEGNGHGRGHNKYKNQRYFRDQDEDYLVRYYNGPRNLPPGLRKKYYRSGTLPPGWQARFQPMPPLLIQELQPVPYGYQRGYYDGYAVVVDPRTRIIYDAIDIVGALSSH